MVGFSDGYPSTSHLPNYMMPFNAGESPEYKDQLAATTTLRASIENKVLESIHGLGPVSRNAGVYSELTLDSFDYDSEPIEIILSCVDTVTHPDLPQYQAQVLTGPRRLNGAYMNAHNYSVPGKEQVDEVARRRDIKLPELRKVELPKINADVLPRVITPLAIDGLLKIFEEADKNEQMEQDLGINNQPIGLAEAKAIALFISRGRLQISKIINTKKN